MPDFNAVLMHIRDIRAEVARLNSRVGGIELRTTAVLPEDAPARLHDAVAGTFNGPELRALAYAVGADYEELDGEGVTDTALKLVLWAQRRGHWATLIAELERQRPHVDWQIYK